MDLSDFEFFAIVDSDSSDELTLPKKFADFLDGCEPRELKLREVGNGRTTVWDMEVVFDGAGRMFLKRGWEWFTRIYGLKRGSFLLCHYDGESMLTVKIFDAFLCRVHYNDNHIGFTKMDAADFEFLQIILDASSEKLGLPKKFAELLKGRELHELKLREVDDRHITWDVGVTFEGPGCMFVKRGWEHFARSYSLIDTNFLLFSFDSDAVLTIKIFDPNMCRRHYYYSDDNASDDDSGPYASDDTDKLIERGPGIRGNLSFDNHCIFGNEVWLNKKEVLQLKHMVENAPEFGPEFTKAGIKMYLKKPVNVNVGCTANAERHNVTMKMGIGKKKAILTRGWTKAMESYNLKKGKYVIFCFQPDGQGLRLEMIVM